MNYIVLDLEWNLPEQCASKVINGNRLTGEIIELGAVKLGSTFERLSEIKIYVRPTFYTCMNKNIVKLTGIHDWHLREQGLPFPEAFDEFCSWCGEDFTLITWSMTDMPMLVENMMVHDIDASVLPDIVDAQRIFGREIMRVNQQISLESAMDVLKITGEKAHDALNDARNTAQICSRMNMEEFIHEYVTRLFVDPEKHPVYSSGKEIHQDDTLRRIPCPWCGEIMTSERWIPWGNTSAAARAVCGEGDEFLIILSRSRSRNGQYHVKRMIFEMSADLWEQYCDKQEREMLAKVS